MARTLQNPNVRRRINKIARAIHSAKRGAPKSPEAGVAAWIANSKKPISQRPQWMKRVAGAKAGERGPNKYNKARKGQKAVTGERSAQAMMAKMVSAEPSTDAERAELAHLKHEVAREFKRQDASGYKGDFVTRAVSRGKGRAYRLKGKKQPYSARYPKRKLPFGGKRAQFIKKGSEAKWAKKGYEVKTSAKGTPYVIVTGFDYTVGDVGGIKKWDATRQGNRKANRTGHTYPAKMAAWLDTHGREWPVKDGLHEPAYGSRTINNPYGAIALDNPALDGVGSYLTGYALPVAVAGAAGGAIHAFSNFGPGNLSAKLTDLVEKIPALGPAINTYVPNTFTGLIAGGLMALVAARTGGDLRKYLALAGGATVAIGGGMDAYNMLAARLSGGGGMTESDDELTEADLGALALDNFGGIALDNLGALALDNMGGIALDNFGDGMAYETAPLAGEQLYGQATLGDAYYSGADFSLGEGQALLNGSQVWMSKFGRPTRRTKKAAGSASHMAGASGHRWGWLIKMVGFRRAASIAALPPKKRIQMLKSLRAGAIKAFQQANLQNRARAVQAATPSIEELVATQSQAGSGQIAPQGACGPQGPGSVELAYGDPALFMS